MSKTKLIFAMVTVVTSTVALMGCGDKNATAPMQMPPPAVDVVSVQEQEVTLMTELSGRANAYKIAEVRPQVNGILEKRLFTEGEMVKANQPLYQIEDDTYIAALKNAKASLKQANANLKQASLQNERATKLIKIKAISQQDYEKTHAMYLAAKATQQSAMSQVDAATINLNYTKVLSPISGQVGRSEVTPGILLSGYQSQKMTIVQQLDPIYIDVTQSAVDHLKIKKEIENGQLKLAKDGSSAVNLVMADGSNYAHHGKLTYTGATIDESTGMINLRAVFPNPKGELLPGMYVRAQISEGVRPKAILLDQRVVQRDAKGNPFVYVVGQESKIEKRAVEIAQAQGNQWVIEKGLKTGEKVVFEGVQRIRVGATVKATEVDPAKQPALKPVF